MDELKKVTLEYEDGRTRVIDKGFVCEFQGKDMVINTTGFSKRDLLQMAYGILAFVEQTGMSEDLEKYIECLIHEEQTASEESENL